MERRVTTNGKRYRVEFRDMPAERVTGKVEWTAYSHRFVTEAEAFREMDRLNASDEALEVWTPVAPLVESRK